MHTVIHYNEAEEKTGMSVQAVRLAACPVGKHCDEVWPPRPNGKRHQLTKRLPPALISFAPESAARRPRRQPLSVN